MTEHCGTCGTYLPSDHGHDLCDTCLRGEVERLRAALRVIGNVWLETGAPPRLGRTIARLTGQVYEL